MLTGHLHSVETPSTEAAGTGSTCMAAGPSPGHLTRPGNAATGERRAAGKCSSAVILAVLLLPALVMLLKKKKIHVISNGVQLPMMSPNIEPVTFMLKRRKTQVKVGLPDPGKKRSQAVTRVTG